MAAGRRPPGVRKGADRRYSLHWLVGTSRSHARNLDPAKRNVAILVNRARSFVCSLNVPGTGLRSGAKKSRKAQRGLACTQMLHGRRISTRPDNPRHPATQPRHDETEQRQTERFNRGLEIQKQKNPRYERREEAAEKPPQVPIVGDRQKPDLAVEADNQADNEKYVAERRHSTPI